MCSGFPTWLVLSMTPTFLWKQSQVDAIQTFQRIFIAHERVQLRRPPRCLWYWPRVLECVLYDAGGTADSGALKVSSLYAQLLVTRSILQEPVVLVRGTRVRLYLLADACYLSCEYMLRNFKPADSNVNKIRFYLEINVGRVLVENAFGLLKGRRRILKRANCSVFRLPKLVAACCVLHNFCQLMEVGEPCDGVGVCIDLHLGWHGNCLGIVRVAKQPWRARHCASTMI